MTRAIAASVVCTLIFPAGVTAQGSLRDSIVREATRAALAGGAVVQQPESPADWNAVLGLEPKAPVRVMSRDGRTIVGSFTSADAGSIVIDRRRGGHETLSVAEVREIRMRPRRSTAGSLGIGALSGLAGGAILGALACPSPCPREDREASAVLTSTFGLAMGSVLGLGIGAVANVRSGKLIYRAPQKSTTP